MTLSATTSYDAALSLLADRPFVVLTGAGLSTDSGIPDYRGPGSPARMPMTYQEFVSGVDAQQRYWARSHLGWSRMRGASPNAGHLALARLDPSLLITQNVDGLHERAGSRSVVALHGRISDVVCLSCRVVVPRAALQSQMAVLNPDWVSRHASVATRPDGDVDLEETAGLRGASLSVRRRAQAGRGVLRRERARCAGGALLRGGRRAGRLGRRAAGRRHVADGDERVPVRAAGFQGGDAGGDRQPGRYARRRPGDVQGRRRLFGVPERPRGLHFRGRVRLC